MVGRSSLGEASIQAEVDSWGRDAKVEDIVHALSVVLGALAEAAQGSLLPETGLEVAKVLLGLRDGMSGAGEGILLLEEGDQLDGVRSVFDGLKSAVDDLVPGDMKNDDTYAAVVDGASGKLGGIITEILEHVRSVVTSVVCWKRTQMRDRSRPYMCDTGYSLAENQWCAPDPGTGGRTLEARCPAAAETRAGWCFFDCHPGFTTTYLHCKQMCLGKYYVDSPLMCGSREGAIAFALLEIVAKTAIAAVTQVGLIDVVKDAGLVLAAQMTDVIRAFVDFAKPFGHPTCPDFFDGMGHGSLR